MTLGLLDILQLAGFDQTKPTKLVRHQSRRHPVEELRRRDWLELYQSYQSKPKFHNKRHDIEQIVSFYGLSGTRAGFYGVYKIRGRCPGSEGRTLKMCPWSRKWRESEFFYDMERDSRFDDLRDRLIIDWGPGTLAWVQNISNKPILEIQERGRRLPPFEDYLEFSLTYEQLTDLFGNEEAHRDWRTSLSAVAGVYLILAEGSGKQYVGSAYGTHGVWGRWREYAKNGHGNNKLLRELIGRRGSRYPKRFRFSLLQILPKTMARDEVIKRETRYKLRLGTRAVGLNGN